MTPLNCFDDIYFKREDTSTTGSAKDRAIPSQIEKLISLGYTSAVISSTGNAAISAQHFCQQKNIKLTIFVSPSTSPSKIAKLTDYRVTPKPVSDAIKYSKSHNSYLLRQSTDESALTGYQSLGTELLDQLPDVSSIFFPVGSGATLVGATRNLPKNIKVFAVQSAYNCPITRDYCEAYTPEDTNLVDALTAKFVPLKRDVARIIDQTGGSGLVASNQEITSSQKLLANNGFNCSPEGGLALAGLLQAKRKFDIGKKPVVIITGTQR